MSARHTQRLRWDVDGRDWPNRAWSSFVYAAGLRWHVQAAGNGPVVLLLHGTGASTHTWRDVMPRLNGHYRVICVDLPGHAFTDPLPAARAGLDGMTAAVGAMLGSLGVNPFAIVGHSAGAAIGARLCLDAAVAPRLLISLNGALLPLAGMPMGMFTLLARLCASTSLVPRVVAWRGSDPDSVRRLVASTGSTLDARGLGLYARLVASPAHVAAVLEMMAAWRLESLQADLSRLAVPLKLIVNSGDRTVPPSEARRVQRAVPAAEVVTVARLGHLSHEEDPAAMSDLMLGMLDCAGRDSGAPLATAS